MAVSDHIQDVQLMYIAYYGRPADPEGLTYWATRFDQSDDLTDALSAFGESEEYVNNFGSLSNEQLVNNLYQQLFNRDADAEGLDFYVGRLESGEATLASIAKQIVDGIQPGTADAQIVENKLTVADTYTDAISDNGATYTAADIPDAREIIANVDASADSVTSGNAAANTDVVANVQTGNVFTLTENTSTVEVAAVMQDPQLVTMWGYAPCSDCESGFKGVPIADLISTIESVAGLDFVELGLIDATENGSIGANDETPSTDDDTAALTGITVTQNDNGSTSVVVTNGEGEVAQAEVQLAEGYYEIINNLLYTADGESRLYQEEMYVALDDQGQPILNEFDNVVYVTSPAVLEAGETVTTNVPIILTPIENNGGTMEVGMTNSENDFIVAGQLDLLHQAYIDGGDGYNTLEIDAKGHFAQPAELLNIQAINIENLPNVYTVDDGDNSSDYPDVQESNSGDPDSIIDLSRATQLENLTITEGDYTGLDADVDEGDLTVVGVRANATLTLEGEFDNDVTVAYSDGLSEGEGVNLVLALGDTTGATFDILQNSATINIDSQGGGNAVDATFGASSLMNMNVSGDAKLQITNDLAPQFQAGTPAMIDASANTAGVDLSIGTDDAFSDEIHFTGSTGDDHFNAVAVRNIEITGQDGDNEFIAVSQEDITIISGNGDNQVVANNANQADSQADVDNEDNVIITLGDGDNDVTAISQDKFAITLGDGNNRVEATATSADDFDPQSVTDEDYSMIVVGEGQNEIDASGSMLAVRTGDGSNEISITGNASAVVMTGAGNDIISAVAGEASTNSVAINAAEGNNSVTVTGYETVNVLTGTGNDALTIVGGNINFGSEDGAQTEVADENGNETMITVDLGSGMNTLTIGTDTDNASQAITAVDGSTIAGENITLVVQSDADLTRADISGVTAVEMGNADGLTLTVSQFEAMGGSTAFSVIGESFGANSVITLVVDKDTDLSALAIDDLPRSIDLAFEVTDGVTLTMTAQQLHERVTADGVSAYADNNGDFAVGTVMITDAGEDFDAFTATLNGSVDPAAGTLNVYLDRDINGYERPVPGDTYTRLEINTDEDLTNGELSPFDTAETFLRITGDSGLEMVPVTGGIDEWGNMTMPMDAIVLGNGTEATLIDFSTVGGSVEGLTFANFENVDAIYGNANTTGSARVDVQLEDDVATDEQGLVSMGVTEFVVVDTDGESASNSAVEGQTTIGYEFYTCETTQGLETLGIQGWLDDTINFMNTERGVDFLIETEYSKADGYGASSMSAQFARPGADAVVNVVALDAVPADEVQNIGFIATDNADSLTLNVTGGDTVLDGIQDYSGDLVSVDLNADADLTISAEGPGFRVGPESVDASGVAGDLSMTIGATALDADDLNQLDFVGAAGTTELTLADDMDFNASSSFTSAGTLNVTVDDGSAVDFTAADTSGISSVTLVDGSMVSLTMDQADAIGAENFMVADGDTGTLNLVGLNDQPFSLANYDVDGTLTITVTLADVPMITLHPDTDLTGITSLEIPDGTTLYLTMEQFQQLEDEGTITDAGVGHLGHLVITDVTQASVGEDGAALDLSELNLNDADSTVTLQFSESVNLTDANLSGAVDTYNFGDDMTLTFGNFEDLDGVAVNGGANSIVDIADATAPTVGVDASSWNFSEVHFLNVVAGGVNVDEDLFINLPESIEKVIYNGEGMATPVSQEVTVEAQTSVDGTFIAFNKSGDDQDTVEIVDFTMNLDGGVYINGNVELSTDVKINPDNDADLLTQGLQRVTINSTGTEANLMNDETANVINGALTPIAPGDQDNDDSDGDAGTVNNTLTDVVINATQELQINGGIVFNSWSEDDYDDDWTINDNDSAAATVTINGTADVALGAIDSSDDDVDSVTINNTGTGNVSVTVDSALIDDNGTDNIDALAFTGGNINLTVSGTAVDLSDDDLSGVASIVVDAAVLHISFAQLNAIGVANVTGTAAGIEALVINGYDGSAFDFTTINEEFEAVQIVTDGTDLDISGTAVDLTGVDSIDANGGSITMTAAQFQQLDGAGLIINATTVTITDLTQAVIDEGSFDLTSVSASEGVVVQVSEDVNLSDDDNIENATDVQIGSNHLGLATHEQADDLVVTGDAASIVSLLFDIDFGANGEIEASGYDIGTLRAIAETVAGLDVEVVIDNLSNDVQLNLFEDPLQVGYVSPIHRVVTIEDGVAVPGDLIFNGQDDSREMRTLTINFEGDANDGRTELEDQDGNLEGSVIEGDLILNRTEENVDLTPNKFQTLTLNSAGAGNSNGITGSIQATEAQPIFEANVVLDEAIANTQTVSIEINGTTYSVVADIPTTHADSQAVLVALATAIEADIPSMTATVITDGLTLVDETGFVIDTDLAKDAGTTTSTTEIISGLENNLLNVEINAESDFTIGGSVVFSSVNADADDATATLTVTGDANTTIQKLDVTDTDVDNLVVNNNGGGTLQVTGASDTIDGDMASLTLSGSGAIYLGNDETQDTPALAADDLMDTISSTDLTSINANALTGALTIENISVVNSGEFTFTAGDGVTNVLFSATELDSSGSDTTIGTVDDTAGWSIDMTGVAADSELHLSGDLTTAATVDGSTFNVTADANTTIYIDSDYDLSELNASLPTASTIVLADEVTLTLTAAQANGLTIIAGTDVDADGDLGTVNIVNLGDNAVDLSGIAADIAGTVTLEDDDVTVHTDTDLGDFSVTLTDVADGVYANDDLAGQTIRFNTVEQAERDIIVDAINGDASTNVVWLFETVSAPVETSGYDADIARLWISEALANGANAEDLYTTLPSTILRVDFADLTDLEVQLNSAPVDRHLELTSFTNLPAGLTFADGDVEEHVQSLLVDMGGQVNVGDIVIGNIIDNTSTYASPVTFNSLTINSVLADDTNDTLAREGFDEEVNVKPASGNTVGDISVGAASVNTDNHIDLLNVTLNTGVDEGTNDLAADSGTNVLTGTDLTVGTITFDSETAGSTATLAVAGANKITATSVDTSDADISTFTMNTSGLLAGGSFDPVAHLDNTESFIITDGTSTSGVGTVIFDEVEGNELSLIDASGSDENVTLTISQIDSNDDDTDADTIPDQDAFTYDASTGVNTITVDAVGANAPTLEAGSTWVFDMTGSHADSTLTIGAGTVFEAGSNLTVFMDAAPAQQLIIDQAVDLSEVNLLISGGDIFVPAGSELTLTIAQINQLNAANVVISGEGTLNATGEVDTDALVNLDLSEVQTVGIDLSAITNVGVIVPQANKVEITLALAGALDDNGDQAGFNVVGTDFNDTIVGSDEGDTFTMGAGDDTVTGGLGSDTFNVDEGTDTITDLTGEADDSNPATDEENDVLVVSAGATADATTVVEGFVATSDTSNAGSASITAYALNGGAFSGDATVDMSLASGPNGYTIIGDDETDDDDVQNEANDGANNTLIGSDFNDIINGGNIDQQDTTDVDVLTGGAGSDVFQFNVNMGNTTSFAQTTTQIAIDREILQVTGPATATGVITVNYTVNGAAFTVNVDVTIGDSVQTIATNIAQELQTNGSFIGNAAVDVLNTNTVVVTAQTGQDIELQATTVAATGVTTNEAEGIDVAQVVELTASGAPTAGDNYSALVDLNAAGSEAGTYTAVGLDASTDVADGIAGNYGTPGTVDAVNTVVGDDVIEFVDQNADDGGFSLAVDTTAAFGGSGASNGTANYLEADIITDFLSGTDKVEFYTATDTDMQAGSGANYLEAAGVADYATALTNANTAFTTNAGTLQYYMTSAADLDGTVGTGQVNGEEGAGVLFFDANLDGTADGVIMLTGVTEAEFAAFDIIVA